MDAPDSKEWTLVVKWRYAAKNGWFWGIDNVRVLDTPPPSPALLPPLAGEEDWPTYRRDPGRRGSTKEKLSFPLRELWRHEAVHTPRPAWPAPARGDVFHNHASLSPTHVFDRADKYLDSDAVFGVKDELVRDYPEHPPGVAPDGSKRDTPWATIEYDFVMAKLPARAA